MIQEFEGFIIEFIPNGNISLTFNLVCFSYGVTMCGKIVVALFISDVGGMHCMGLLIVI